MTPTDPTPDEMAAVAQALGVPVSEISKIEATDDGVVITMFDGHDYIVVPTDHPDRDGKTGLMYFHRPAPNYSGSFPVFAAAPVVVVVAETPVDETPGFPGAAAVTAAAEIEEQKKADVEKAAAANPVPPAPATAGPAAPATTSPTPSETPVPVKGKTA